MVFPIQVLSTDNKQAFQFGWGPVCWIYVSEIPTSRLRGLNVSLAAATQWIFNLAVARATPVMLNNAGAHGYGTYFIYGSFNFVIAIGAYFLVPETKGVSTNQTALEALLTSGRSRSSVWTSYLVRPTSMVWKMWESPPNMAILKSPQLDMSSRFPSSRRIPGIVEGTAWGIKGLSHVVVCTSLAVIQAHQHQKLSSWRLFHHSLLRITWRCLLSLPLFWTNVVDIGALRLDLGGFIVGC